MKKFFKKLTTIPFYCAAVASVGPKALKDPNEWIKYGDNQMRGKSSEGKMVMNIETPQWKREMELLSKVQGRDKSIVFIQSPAKEKGIGTLRLEMKMWNYFPKLKRTVTISPSMLLSSWMGSDFSNDDLLKASSMIEDYNHKFLADDKIGNQKYKVIENTAKDNAKVTWPKILSYVSPNDCLPREQRYYDQGGKLMRTMKLSEVKTMGGHLIPTQLEMQNENTKDQKTILKYQDIKYDVDFNDSEFTMKNLTK